MTKAIAITSGKGGAGKTNISVNLALHLATLGYRTCLLAADLGLANANLLLGLYPGYNLENVILYHRDLEDMIIRNVALALAADHLRQSETNRPKHTLKKIEAPRSPRGASTANRQNHCHKAEPAGKAIAFAVQEVLESGTRFNLL